MGNAEEIYKKLLSLISDDYKVENYNKTEKYIAYPGNGFKRICLHESEHAPSGTFSLAIYASDTCEQAKKLYKHFNFEKVMALEALGWRVQSHFHFGWQRSNILFTEGDKSLPLSEYIEYWKLALEKKEIKEYKKTEFDFLLQKMKLAKMMNDGDISRFNEFFRTKNYQSASTRPGIINLANFSKVKLTENIYDLADELNEYKQALIRIYG